MFWDDVLDRHRPANAPFWPVANAEGIYIGISDANGSIAEQAPLYQDQHAVDALGLFASSPTGVLPVVSRDLQLLGGLTALGLSQWMGRQWCVQLPGSSVWFQSSVHISGSWIQALEAEGYRVVAMGTDFAAESNLFGTWVRLDQLDPTAAVETLERLGATVLGSYPPGRRHNEALEHLDHLFHYLNF